MVLLVQVVPHDDSELIAVAHRIRQKVFLDEYGFDPALDSDASDAHPTTLHFLGFDTELQQHVAVARSVVLPDGQSVQISRIAVLTDARGRRHGLTLVQFATTYILAWPDVRIQKMLLFCPLDKCAFYEKCGFVRGHDSELVRGIMLCEMIQYRDT